jgi:hypothetical protein
MQDKPESLEPGTEEIPTAEAMRDVPWPERTVWIQKCPRIGRVCEALLFRWETWDRVIASKDGRDCVRHYLEAPFGEGPGPKA